MRTVGLNRAGSVWITPADVALLAQAGMSYRVDFRDEFGDELRDRAHRLLGDAKVRYLPILIWNNDRPQGTDGWQAWKGYVQHVVSRYPAQRHWQLWNEPNNERVPNTFFDGDLDAWRGFLRRTSRYVKQANPDAVVVSGGVAVGGHGSRRAGDMHTAWFRVNEIVDRVAVHTYCADPDEAARVVNNARRAAEQPVWCTELGRKSTVDGEAGQADWYGRVAGLTARVPLFWFCLQDVGGAFDGFGARRADRSEKPVWDSLCAPVR